MPIAGEVAKAKDIHFKNKALHIWVLCVKCGEGRWVSKRSTERPNYTGMCIACWRNHPVWESIG